MKLDKWLHIYSDKSGVKFTVDEVADVRENVKSEKVISGGSADSDGATLWFRCSACDGSVDISDNFCKHCGADMRGEA